MLKTFPSTNFDDLQFINLSQAQPIDNINDNDMITQEITTYITDSFDLSLLPPTTTTTTTTHTELNNFNQFDIKSNIPQILIHPTINNIDQTNSTNININTNNFTEYRNIKDEPHLLSPCYYSVSSPDSYSNISSPVSYCGSTSSTTSSLINIFDEVQIFNDIFPPNEPKPNNDHKLLRQALKDMSFQKKHNIKTLDIDLGGFQDTKTIKETRTANEPIELEPVLSLAMQQMKEDVKRTCTTLSISLDIKQWTCQHTELWLKWALMQLGLGGATIQLPLKLTSMNGKQLSALNEMELIAAIGNFELGSTLFAQLEIWKAACQDVTLDQQQQEQIMEEYRNSWLNITPPNSKENSITTNKSQVVLVSTSAPSSPNHSEEILNSNPNTIKTTTNRKIVKRRRTNIPLQPAPTAITEQSTINNNDLTSTNKQQNTHIHLWQFLKELLESPQTYSNCIRWIEPKNGIFKIEDSLGVAQLWGKRKNRPAMNYDKLSRSIRQYYKKGIMKKTEKSQRLVYQFCRPYFN